MMALQMYKCQCGVEFEDSEFRVTHECDECRQPTRPTRGLQWLEMDNLLHYQQGVQAAQQQAAQLRNQLYTPQNQQMMYWTQTTPPTLFTAYETTQEEE